MESARPEHEPRKRAIEELVRGRELAYKLQVMVRSRALAADATTPISPSAADHQDLVAKILGSFTETISILLNSGDHLHASNCNWPPDIGLKSSDQDSSGSCKLPSSASKDRRGWYKRRKTSETWTKETPIWIDDGHAWRKYGQKVILNAEYPRNYFRCTHKFDQDCQATKQVQKIQDNPPLFRTTYYGHHTCKSLLLKPTQLDFDSTAAGKSSILLSFQLNNDKKPLMKRETKEEVPSLLQYPSPVSPDHYFMPQDPEFITFETTSAGPMISTPLSSGSDYGDVISSGVYSCSATSNHSSLDLEMDMVVGGSVDTFDDVLQFEF